MFAARVSLLGESRVGKTTLVRSARAGEFRPAPECTYGVEVTRTNGLQCWDVGGAHPPVSQIMARHAAVIVLAFTDTTSFLALDTRWLPVARAAQAESCAQGFAAPRLVLARLQSDRVGGDVAAHDAVHAAYARHIGAHAYTTVTAHAPASVAACMALLAQLATSDAALPRENADLLVV